jgi:3-dehydroquinate dehydratase / shikimate dehydrogenase
MICVSIGRGRHKQILAEHAQLVEDGAELVELRLDYIRTAVNLKRLTGDRPGPVVITCRRREDGGMWSGTKEARQVLLRSAIASGVEYVDLEEDLASVIPRFGSTKRIVSYHNFRETPGNIESVYDRMLQLDADILKIVAMANSPSDNLKMLELINRSDVPTVAFCMGDIGTPSRILCGAFGAPFTYATFHHERSLAPGQLSYHDMVKQYRYNDLNSDTEVFGVIADPVGHSMSPLLHNRTFRDYKMNRVYLPFRVTEEELGEFLEECPKLGIRGLSVTIPHKEEILRHVNWQERAVSEIGAGNTILFDPKKGSVCYNTDYHAALSSIVNEFHSKARNDEARAEAEAALAAKAEAEAEGKGTADGQSQDDDDPEMEVDTVAEPIDKELRPSELSPVRRIDDEPVDLTDIAVLKDKTALILGAGGAAKAIAFALSHAGAQVVVTNRTEERARALADSLKCVAVNWTLKHEVNADLIVNCTPIGMHPNLDVSPIEKRHLRRGTIVFDTVYNPEQTLLLKQAREMGCRIISGIEMFVRQAAMQFELFTGEPQPLEAMRTTMRRAISPVRYDDDED